MHFSDKRVKTFLDENIEFSEESRKKLADELALPDVQEILVLPDVHAKPDNPFPTGVVTVTSNTLFPSAIGQEIGCGMRVLRTSLMAQDMTTDRIDRVYEAIKALLRDGKKTLPPLLSEEEYRTMLLQGENWAKDRFSVEKEYFSRPHKDAVQGRKWPTRRELDSAIPNDSFWGGFDTLGVLAGGNHFLEMQVVSEVFDHDLCRQAGLSKGQIVFMFHTGSGLFSKRIDNYYGFRLQTHAWYQDIRKNFRKVLFHLSDLRFWRFPHRLRMFFSAGVRGVTADSIEGRRYMTAFDAAMNYSFSNRAFISDFIRQALEKEFGSDCEVRLLSDTSHECISKEKVDGKICWLHRNGATLIPQNALVSPDVLAIPSFMGGPSFLCFPDEGIRQSRYSVNHGTGRLFTKEEARVQFNLGDINKDLSARGVRLYKIGKGDLREQAPQAFKGIENVISVLKKKQLVKPIATIVPLAVLKG